MIKDLIVFFFSMPSTQFVLIVPSIAVGFMFAFVSLTMGSQRR